MGQIPRRPLNDPEAERAEGACKPTWQAVSTSVGAARRASRTAARQARSVAIAAKATVGNLSEAAVSQTGLVGGKTSARFSEFGAALNKAISEQMQRLDRKATRLREDPVEWCKATAASVSAAFLTVEQMVPSFSDLAPAMKAKFAMAGLPRRLETDRRRVSVLRERRPISGAQSR